MNSVTPLACNMGVFTSAQREHHIHTTTQLVAAVQTVQDMENGYQFLFPNKAELISQIAEFIANERLCCPFLKFSLNVASNNDPISLFLSGPIGTREFLRAEFAEAFS